MKKCILFVVIFLLSVAFASAETGLQNYPNLFVSNGRLNAVTVVGDKSTSSNVLAQISIYSSLSNLEYDVNVKNKLSTEVDGLNQNLISVGNPCVNPITDEIMGFPQPCDKDFPKGKAFIKLFSKNGFNYIVVAGYSDSGTRKAANVLANYKDYQFLGNDVAINVEGETQEEAATTVGSAPKQETASSNANSNQNSAPVNDTVKINSNDTIISSSTNVQINKSETYKKNQNTNNEAGSAENTKINATEKSNDDVATNADNKENPVLNFFKWIFGWFK